MKYVPFEQKGYYNSDLPFGWARLVENLAEDTFFYSRLLRRESVFAGVFVFVAGLGAIVGLRYGSAELVEMLALLMLFGEFGLGRVFRMRWMISQMELVHLDCLRWFRERALETEMAKVEAMRLFAEYESMKSRGAVRARDRTFDTMNPRLTAEWEL